MKPGAGREKFSQSGHLSESKGNGFQRAEEMWSKACSAYPLPGPSFAIFIKVLQQCNLAFQIYSFLFCNENDSI